MRYLLLLIFALSACTPSIRVTSTPVKNPTRIVEIAKAEIIDDLVDPESVRFKKNFKAYALSNGDYAVCGSYNAKNRMGGYGGYKPFIMRIRNGKEYQFFRSLAPEHCGQLAAGNYGIYH